MSSAGTPGEKLLHEHSYCTDEQEPSSTRVPLVEDPDPPAYPGYAIEKAETIESKAMLNGDKPSGSPADEENPVPNDSVETKRETWGSKVDFLLSIIGFAVDLANLWRFPYLCYKNGGGAFLIPYFLMLGLGALPLFYMELILGQFHRRGAISLWRIAPIFKGIGWASVWMAWIVAFYYNVIIGWAFFYLFVSMQKTLPWTTCDNAWNTKSCIPIDQPPLELNSSAYNSSINALVSGFNISHNSSNETGVSSTIEYFEFGVLQVQHASGIEQLGEVRWPLALTTLLSFLVLYFSLWKGVASSGKVVWVTATAPYVVLAILMVRGVMLPGASQGILYFITPKLDGLLRWEVWIEAANQIFYSVGAGFGVHLAYASYNKFDNNCYRDCLITAGVNSFTSIFSGIVVFSYIGYMANRIGTNIEDVAMDGPGLVFTAYPEAVATLLGSQAWAIIFFLLMLTLGLDSAMGGLEAVITGLKDEYRDFFMRYRYSREILVLIVCVGGYLFALVNTTQGGLYTITLLDTFSAGTSLLFTVFLEAVAVSWVYGLDQFCADTKHMLGFTPGIYWRICWKFISPTFVLFIVLAGIASFRPLSVETLLGVYVYPTWANVLGWMLCVVTISLIPITAVYQCFRLKGSIKQRIALALSPEWEHEIIKKTGVVRRFQLRHWMSLGNGMSLNCKRQSFDLPANAALEMKPAGKKANDRNFKC